MKSKRPSKSKALQPVAPSFDGLVRELREFITESRRQIVRAVDVAQVRTCWGVGRHIVEFEQGGAARAEYGAKLLPQLAAKLTADFGKGFDERNLFYMKRFYLAFPILNAVRSELSWTHYRTLLRIEDPAAREWYANEAIAQNWSSRALDRQVNRLYYERLLSSKDRQAVRAEAEEKIAALPPSPRDFVRDPVLLEFLGLPETGRLLESNLEQRLIDHLQAFLLELGKGFAFVARQMRVSTDTKDFYIDLVFYNYLLKCFVLFDLKPRELTHGDIGQMDIYPVRYCNEHIPLRLCPALAQRRKLLRRLHERPAASFGPTSSRGGSQHSRETARRTRLLRGLPVSSRCNEAREVSQNGLGKALHQDSSPRLSHGVNVRIFDEQQRGAGDNPTVGIILCAAKDASMARYSVLHGNEQLFATRYKLVLPTEEELRIELIREQRLLEEQSAAPPDQPAKKKKNKPAR